VSNQVDGAELVLSLESKQQDKLEEAREMLLCRLPPSSLLAERRDSDVLNSPLAPEGSSGSFGGGGSGLVAAASPPAPPAPGPS
jgi:hypothetical protein